MSENDALLRGLVDRAAIHDLVVAYAKARDTTDADLYRRIFAPDAMITAFGGRVLSGDLEAILAKVATDRIRFNPEAKEGERSFGLMRHLVSNVDVAVDGDRASSDYYVVTIGNNPGKQRPELVSEARHADEYARRDGRWWVVRSAMTFGWSNDAMGQILKAGPYTPPEYRR